MVLGPYPKCGHPAQRARRMSKQGVYSINRVTTAKSIVTSANLVHDGGQAYDAPNLPGAEEKRGNAGTLFVEAREQA